MKKLISIFLLGTVLVSHNGYAAVADIATSNTPLAPKPGFKAPPLSDDAIVALNKIVNFQDNLKAKGKNLDDLEELMKRSSLPGSLMYLMTKWYQNEYTEEVESYNDDYEEKKVATDVTRLSSKKNDYKGRYALFVGRKTPSVSDPSIIAILKEFLEIKGDIENYNRSKQFKTTEEGEKVLEHGYLLTRALINKMIDWYINVYDKAIAKYCEANYSESR